MNANKIKSSAGIFGAYLCLSVALVQLNGCKTFDGGKPDWLANPKSVYPDDQFLSAVGAGDTRRAAENSAAASLSRIFESRIESDERLSDQSRETNTSFERTTDFERG